MKKHLIAAAVAAAVAVPAAAQVTIYGNIDTAYQDGEYKFSDRVGGTSGTSKGSGMDVNNGWGDDTKGALSSSAFGIRGDEDLGGGLKASFNLEWEHNTGTGNSEMAQARTSKVGVEGSFGSFEFGRQTTGIHGVLAGNSAIGGSNGIGEPAYTAGTIDDLSVNFSYRMHDYVVIGARGGTEGVRIDNGIVYRSPTMSGFQMRIDYAQDKVDSQSPAEAPSGLKLKTQGLSATYNAGPLALAVGTHTITENDPTVAGRSAINAETGAATATARVAYETLKDKVRTNAMSAKYNLGPATLHFLHATKKEENNGARSLDQDMTAIGVTVPHGAWSFRAQIGQGSVEGATAAEKIDTEALQLAAIYSLSKRTSVYAMYGEDEAKQDASATADRVGDKASREQFALGLRHTF